jgi:hypothetical protein
MRRAGNVGGVGGGEVHTMFRQGKLKEDLEDLDKGGR